jgi:hypothetical protein
MCRNESCMRYRYFLFLGLAAFGVLASSVASAAEFQRLDLLDGRTLKDVDLRSYDAETDKVLLLSNGKAYSVPAKLVPPPFADQFRKRGQSPGSSVSTVSAPVLPTSQPASVTRTPAAIAAATAPAVGAASQTRRPKAIPATPPPEPAAASAEAHAEIAATRASRFFRYEFKAGSDSISVTVLNVDVTACEAIPGWKGRYRTQGHAYLGFYDSKGGSFQRANRGFEVITEEKNPGGLGVIDFSQK